MVYGKRGTDRGRQKRVRRRKVGDKKNSWRGSEGMVNNESVI